MSDPAADSPMCEQCGRPAVKRRWFVQSRFHHPDDYRRHWVCQRCIWRGRVIGLVALALLIGTSAFIVFLLLG